MAKIKYRIEQWDVNVFIPEYKLSYGLLGSDGWERFGILDEFKNEYHHFKTLEEARSFLKEEDEKWLIQKAKNDADRERQQLNRRTFKWP